SSYLITVLFEGEMYLAEVKVVGRELVKTNVGSFKTVVTRVNLKSRRDYGIRAYFTDDERRVPVLVTAKHPDGQIRAELAGSEIVGSATATTVPRTGGPQPIQPGPQTPVTPIRPATAPGSAPTSSPGAVLAPLDLPFKIGEQLNYQIYLAGTAA